MKRAIKIKEKRDIFKGRVVLESLFRPLGGDPESKQIDRRYINFIFEEGDDIVEWLRLHPFKVIEP